LGKPKIRPWTSGDGTKSGLALDTNAAIDVPQQLQDELKLPPRIVLFGSCFLDTTADGTGLSWAPGHNRDLGRYREATGLNTPGQPFSPSMLEGKVVKIRPKHDTVKGEIVDKLDVVLKA